jgi:hypothetical protein
MSGLHGWPIVGVSAVLVGAVVAGGLLVLGPSEAGLRFAVRATARTSLPLFLAAFVASSLRRTWPGAATRWLLANRRYVGVSFAVSHLFHGLAIAALAATSFDRTAAWLGPRRWKRLHAAGVYHLWLVFLVTVGPQAGRGPLYALSTLALLAAFGLRLHARRTQLAAVGWTGRPPPPRLR